MQMVASSSGRGLLDPGLHDAADDGYVLDLGEADQRVGVQDILDVVVPELLPLARLQEVLVEGLPGGNVALDVEALALPHIARILGGLEEPEARNQDALDRGAGHDHAMGHLLAQAKDTAIGQGAHVDEVRLVAIRALRFLARRSGILGVYRGMGGGEYLGALRLGLHVNSAALGHARRRLGHAARGYSLREIVALLALAVRRAG